MVFRPSIFITSNEKRKKKSPFPLNFLLYYDLRFRFKWCPGLVEKLESCCFWMQHLRSKGRTFNVHCPTLCPWKVFDPQKMTNNINAKTQYIMTFGHVIVNTFVFSTMLFLVIFPCDILSVNNTYLRVSTWIHCHKPDLRYDCSHQYLDAHQVLLLGTYFALVLNALGKDWPHWYADNNGQWSYR